MRRGRWGVDDTSDVVAFRSVVTVVALRSAETAAGGVDALEFEKVACEIYFSRSARGMFVSCQHTGQETERCNL